MYQSREEMIKRISELESLNDQLLTEVHSLDKLLKKVGFEEGLKTLKSAAIELMDEEESDYLY